MAFVSPKHTQASSLEKPQQQQIVDGVRTTSEIEGDVTGDMACSSLVGIWGSSPLLSELRD